MAPPVSERVRTLRIEVAGFEALNRLLASEAEALRRVDADTLSSVSQAKLEQVNVLQALARQRSQEMKRLGFPETRDGVEAWLAQGGDAAAAHELWQHLTQLAVEAKRQNDINGRLAARQRWHFDAALGALVQAAGVASTTYGADGRTRHSQLSQSHLSV